MSDTPETDAIVRDAEEMCLRAGLSGMEFWREMYGILLSRMRRRETEGYPNTAAETVRFDWPRKRVEHNGVDVATALQMACHDLPREYAEIVDREFWNLLR